MTFETYYEIMKTHGISELLFRYDGEDMAVTMGIDRLRLRFVIQNGRHYTSYYDLDACVNDPVFGGRCLRDIWDEIEIIDVDCESVEEYDPQECSIDYVQYVRDLGELLWSCNLGPWRSFWILSKYMLLGALPVPILSMLLPLMGHSNWNILYLSGGCAILALIIWIIVFLRNPIEYDYQITTNKIFLFNGLARDVTFSGIRNIKLRRCLWNPSRGTIYLKLKKGMSINYVLENIPEADRVYALIMERLQEVKEHGTAINE